MARSASAIRKRSSLSTGRLNEKPSTFLLMYHVTVRVTGWPGYARRSESDWRSLKSALSAGGVARTVTGWVRAVWLSAETVMAGITRLPAFLGVSR